MATCALRLTRTMSPGASCSYDCMSKCAIASRSSVISISITTSSFSTIGRFDSVCGATGTSSKPASDGYRIGPSADSAYAVEPVGVATMTASARWLYIVAPSTRTVYSTMPPVTPRDTTMSFSAAA